MQDLLYRSPGSGFGESGLPRMSLGLNRHPAKPVRKPLTESPTPRRAVSLHGREATTTPAPSTPVAVVPPANSATARAAFLAVLA